RGKKGHTPAAFDHHPAGRPDRGSVAGGADSCPVRDVADAPARARTRGRRRGGRPPGADGAVGRRAGAAPRDVARRPGRRVGARVAGVPVKWRAPLRRTLDAAARTGETAVTETDFGSASLVMGAKQATSGGLAWTAYLVPPATYLGPLRTAITALAAATVLL